MATKWKELTVQEAIRWHKAGLPWYFTMPEWHHHIPAHTLRDLNIELLPKDAMKWKFVILVDE